MMSAADDTPRNEFTGLLRAVWDSRTDEVRALLAAGADVNQKDTEGATPLHLAAANNNEELIRLLLAAGANPSARDNNGDTPADFVYAPRYPHLVELLQTAQHDIVSAKQKRLRKSAVRKGFAA